MKRVVSYSFFRNDNSAYEHPNCGEARGKVFLNYIRLIVRAHHCIWPLWTLRFHHDDRVMEFPYFKAMRRMEEVGLLELRYFGKSKTLCGEGGMLERMKPAFDPDVEYFICRDIDSIPLPRDRRAVEEFIASGKAVHVIHGESSSHAGIMGGTFGAHAARFRKLTRCDTFHDMIGKGSFAEGESWNKHGGDQHHLARNLWPWFHRDLLLHELHHITDVPCDDTRRVISGAMPSDVNPQAAEHGDSFSNVIGGCSDVDKPYAFYDSLDLPIMEKIRECEK